MPLCSATKGYSARKATYTQPAVAVAPPAADTGTTGQHAADPIGGAGTLLAHAVYRPLVPRATHTVHAAEVGAAICAHQFAEADRQRKKPRNRHSKL
jgi:molybdate-binding protein